MGTTAENICDVWGITREELDAFGAASQQKTEAAQASGRFDAEIVPVPVKVKKEIVEFKKDEFPRAGSTPEGLAKLKGAFPVGPEGVEDQVVHTFQPTEIHEADTRKHVQRVTAGNASRDAQASRGQEGSCHPLHRRRPGRCHRVREVLRSVCRFLKMKRGPLLRSPFSSAPINRLLISLHRAARHTRPCDRMRCACFFAVAVLH